MTKSVIKSSHKLERLLPSAISYLPKSQASPLYTKNHLQLCTYLRTKVISIVQFPEMGSSMYKLSGQNKAIKTQGWHKPWIWRTLGHFMDILIKYHFHNASKESFWPQNNFNFMQGFKSAILAIFQFCQNGAFEPF